MSNERMFFTCDFKGDNRSVVIPAEAVLFYRLPNKLYAASG